MSTLDISLGATPRVTDLPAGTRRARRHWPQALASCWGPLSAGSSSGYGARIAYGCNIGAYFSGIASSSLHGWIWGITAFAGSIMGTHLSFRRRLIAPAAPPLSLPPGETRQRNGASLVREAGASARNEDQSLAGHETSRVTQSRPMAATPAPPSS